MGGEGLGVESAGEAARAVAPEAHLLRPWRISSETLPFECAGAGISGGIPRFIVDIKRRMGEKVRVL